MSEKDRLFQTQTDLEFVRDSGSNEDKADLFGDQFEQKERKQPHVAWGQDPIMQLEIPQAPVGAYQYKPKLPRAGKPPAHRGNDNGAGAVAHNDLLAEIRDRKRARQQLRKVVVCACSLLCCLQ